MLNGSAVWISGKQFVGESGTGHAIVLDSSADIGGRNTGASPMELLLVGLAGCTGIDVVFILNDRMKKPITSLTVRAAGERAAEPPRVFTKIELSYSVAGPGLQEKDAVRAIQLSAEKFCSASVMLGQTAELVHRYDVTDTTSGTTRSGLLTREQG